MPDDIASLRPELKPRDVAARLEQIRIGDPLDPATGMGPLVNQAQLERVNGCVAAGQADGAALTARTARMPAEGYFVQPGVFTGVRPEMSLAQEEIFGPILSVLGHEKGGYAVEEFTHLKAMQIQLNPPGA